MSAKKAVAPILKDFLEKDGELPKAGKEPSKVFKANDLRCEFEFLCFLLQISTSTVVDYCETFWIVIAAHETRDFHEEVGL